MKLAMAYTGSLIVDLMLIPRRVRAKAIKIQ